jgi:hypothetical protein
MLKLKAGIVFLMIAIIALPVVADQAADTQAVANTIESWARAWENNVNSLDGYRAFYHPGFFANYKSRSGMDYGQWMADKQAKAQKTGCIQITISGLKVQIQGDIATARFSQKYVSQTYCDQGEKTLYLTRDGRDWKIIGEEQPSVTRCSESCSPGGGASPGPAPNPPTAAPAHPVVAKFSSTPKDFQAFYYGKNSNCQSAGCARYNASGACEKYDLTASSPGDGISADLNGDGQAEYVFSCFEPAHGPTSADVFAKIGGKWKDLGPGFTFFDNFAEPGAFTLLDQTDCGFHRFNYRFQDEIIALQFDGENYVFVSNSPTVKCKTLPPPSSTGQPTPGARPPISRCSGLQNESLAGIKLRDDVGKVHSIIGKPQSTTRPELQEMTGEYTWEEKYPAKGIEFGMSRGEQSKVGGSVYSIRVFGNSPAFTSSGIGLGSSIADVEAAYGKGNSDGNQYRFTIYDPPNETCCGRSLDFTLANGTVVEIKFYDFEE